MTSAAADASKLQQELRAAGLIASDLGLYGRFHADRHRAKLQPLIDLCRRSPDLQFPPASALMVPCRSNNASGLITQGDLHEHALQSILTDPPQWFRTFDAIQAESLHDDNARLIAFGPETCVPPSFLRQVGPRIVDQAHPGPPNISGDASLPSGPRVYADSDIAVVGMACKVAGADNLEQFWDLLCAGQSQHQEVPRQRLAFNPALREIDPKRKWFGNFIDGPDEFDHKFFKKSPRESASMDPQQRHLLQIAYQAVEQSGYFRHTQPDRRVGCYIGATANDYQANTGCHPPNAFTATGNLRGFLAGKVSHWFGWTGPGLVFDTACSSSAVAVHQACRAILGGECNAALAGGTQILTDPLWFENLSGASFLSPTGQCKPFDAKGDGYCRGEGIGAVFLKRLSSALQDGDQILGTIAGTAVQQNENCTPIVVPNAPSLSDLFRTVTDQARVAPSQVSVVEAHGTGTAVGDPAEYDSIRQVFGGSTQPQPLQLSSVKGLIGHLEGTAGIASLIKVLLMLHKEKIPPQASFDTLNPAIPPMRPDNISIPTEVRPWTAEFKAALINNYGASGSNASMVLTQPPKHASTTQHPPVAERDGDKHLFWLCGMDDQSLRRYATVLRRFLSAQSATSSPLTVANLSFQLARQSNRSLGRALMFTSQSMADVDHTLHRYEKADSDVASVASPAAKPVILCFGGQVSTFVGLDQNLYERVAVLRKHLNRVDAVARRFGVGSLFPGMFQRTPVDDVVQLQVMLFALQYACAHSWMESGIRPTAVVGHSFGELTALCVSGTLSLDDAVNMIARRAALIRDVWGADKGAMMAVEADVDDVRRLLADAGARGDGTASIACYNGPRSFTLAGSTAAIDAVAATLADAKAFASIKAKRLNVTNAFHCALVDPLTYDLERIGQGLTFREARIPMERATAAPSRARITAEFIASQMREPVYFHHALQRLSEAHPSSIFLEAGSKSTITLMASRALGSPSGSHFQALDITSGNNAWSNLVDATVSLWKGGSSVQHWAHHALQTPEHAPLLLPPYQFEKSTHWVEYKPLQNAVAAPAEPSSAEQAPVDILTFIGHDDADKRRARFRINTMTAKYHDLVSGHVFVQTAPICPATVQLDLIIEAIRSVRPDLADAQMTPRIEGVKNQSPICANASRATWIDLHDEHAHRDSVWAFEVYSTDAQKARAAHTTGRIIFRSAGEPESLAEFSCFERLVSHERCVELLHSDTVDDVIQGRNIYKTFSDVVDYGKMYQGVEKIVGRKGESAGHVVKKYNPETWLDACLADSFCQVGGLWVNCMTDRVPANVFIASGIEKYIRSPQLRQSDARLDAYHVYATHQRRSDKQYLTDVFAFDADTGTLLEVVLGITYVEAPKASLSKLLARLTFEQGQTASSDLPPPPETTAPAQRTSPSSQSHDHATATATTTTTAASAPVKKRPSVDVAAKVKAILVELSGIEMSDIKPDSDLADLGIDSLMGMEMAREIEKAFQISLPEHELMEITDLPGLLKCVRSHTTDGADPSTEPSGGESEGDASEDTDARSEHSAVFTPAPAGSSLSSSDVEMDSSSEGESPKAKEAGLKLDAGMIREAFNATKRLTDDRIVEYGQTRYADEALPLQTQMCVALIIEAFQQLGCSLRDAHADEHLTRIPHAKEHGRFVDHLYKILAEEAGLLTLDGATITRTPTPCPSPSSKERLAELHERFPDQTGTDDLTFYVGSQLAQILAGKVDGVKLIFGAAEGRELVSALYGDWPLNQVMFRQMGDFVSRLASSQVAAHGPPLKILEMGAGTGGTTKRLAPLLAELHIPVEYTFTDLAPSLVAAARKRFKAYDFMRFRTHDIEKAPADDLLGTQHIVIASNAIHATHSLRGSGANVRKALRPDGLLMMTEMTARLYWADIVFGVFEGWWFFDDGRTHAVADAARWEQDLQAVGYGHVDWSDGARPENALQRLIVAMAEGPAHAREQVRPTPPPALKPPADLTHRQVTVERYVQKMTAGFAATREAGPPARPRNAPAGRCVLVTGATGSLGCHLVEKLVATPDVARVVCLNRRSRLDPAERQHQALAQKGITLAAPDMAKLRVWETDMAKPALGLPATDYADLLGSVTDIIHNGWLMNAKWPLSRFEPQLQIMRHLLDFAWECSFHRRTDDDDNAAKLTFQFISSIAVVGHWPLATGTTDAPETPMPLAAVLPTGYADAKYICERMLDATLRQHPARFRAMAVRAGQVAGSSRSGFWNPREHFAFLVKSSRAVGALPDFPGKLSWCPVDAVAATLVDLVALPSDVALHPVYHVENPHHQPWRDMIPVLARALGLPEGAVIGFREWVRRVRDFPAKADGPEGENPASLLVDFLDDNFLRMSCGGLFLDTANTRAHSKTLAALGPVSEALARKYVEAWRDMGFL